MPCLKTIEAVPLIKYFPLFFSGILFYKMKFDKVTAWRLVLLTISFCLQLSLFNKCYNIRGYMSFGGYSTMLSIYYITFLLFLAGKLRFIVNKVTSQLGEISYSLYLIHQFISIKIVISQLMKMGCNFWVAAFEALITSITLSLLINCFVEKPSLLYCGEWYKNLNRNQQVSEKKASLAYQQVVK